MTVKERDARFQRWLREHIGLMLKVVRAYTSTPHDREDLFQEVLVNLWSSIPNFRGDSKETTWIYRVSINTALVWKPGERRRMDAVLHNNTGWQAGKPENLLYLLG